MKHRNTVFRPVAVLLVAASGRLFAQSSGLPPAAAPDMLLEEVIVTAEKRAESLQKVPIAVTAVSGDELANRGITNLEGLQAVVPNLVLGQQLGVARISLRGVGLDNLSTGAEGSIAFHVDGVFVSRAAGALSAFYDVDRVEVLRGPQGTLYGRNTTGGSINVLTKSPTESLTGYVQATGGTVSRIGLDGAISGPLIGDKVLGRLAFRTNDHDGYGTNVATGRQIDNARARSARVKLEFLPADNLTAILTGDYHWEHDNGNGYHYLGSAGETASGAPITPYGFVFGGLATAARRDISNEADPYNRRTLWNASADVQYSPEAYSFRSITSYRSTDYFTSSDLDSTSFQLAPITQTEDARQLSQEFQLSGSTTRSNWIVGTYYFQEKINGGIEIPYNDIAVGGSGVLHQGYFGGGQMKTKAAALFGQYRLSFTEALRGSVGVRYSWEEKEVVDLLRFDLVNPFVPGRPVVPLAQCAADQPSVPGCDPDHTWTSLTPKLGLEYSLSSDTLLYASVSKGFKSGTYNLGGVQKPVNPEEVRAFEVGVKSIALDDRLRVNLAGFYYRYTDLQVGKVVNASLALENAADATLYGLELEMRAKLSRSLEVGLVASYLNATFDGYVSVDPSRPGGDGTTIDPDSGLPAFDNAGNRLPQAPKYTLNADVAYSIPSDSGTWTLRADGLLVDGVYFTAFNRESVAQKRHSKLNASLAWESPANAWSATVYGHNLANDTVVSNAFVSSSIVGFPINGFLEEPRRYGITIGYSF